MKLRRGTRRRQPPVPWPLSFRHAHHTALLRYLEHRRAFAPRAPPPLGRALRPDSPRWHGLRRHRRAGPDRRRGGAGGEDRRGGAAHRVARQGRDRRAAPRRGARIHRHPFPRRRHPVRRPEGRVGHPAGGHHRGGGAGRLLAHPGPEGRDLGRGALRADRSAPQRGERGDNGGARHAPAPRRGPRRPAGQRRGANPHDGDGGSRSRHRGLRRLDRARVPAGSVRHDRRADRLMSAAGRAAAALCHPHAERGRHPPRGDRGGDPDRHRRRMPARDLPPQDRGPEELAQDRRRAGDDRLGAEGRARSHLRPLPLRRLGHRAQQPVPGLGPGRRRLGVRPPARRQHDRPEDPRRGAGRRGAGGRVAQHPHQPRPTRTPSASGSTNGPPRAARSPTTRRSPCSGTAAGTSGPWSSR